MRTQMYDEGKCKDREEAAVGKPRREASKKTNPAGTLILDL